jgi:hypothetical protein
LLSKSHHLLRKKRINKGSNRMCEAYSSAADQIWISVLENNTTEQRTGQRKTERTRKEAREMGEGGESRRGRTACRRRRGTRRRRPSWPPQRAAALERVQLHCSRSSPAMGAHSTRGCGASAAQLSLPSFPLLLIKTGELLLTFIRELFRGRKWRANRERERRAGGW